MDWERNIIKKNADDERTETRSEGMSEQWASKKKSSFVCAESKLIVAVARFSIQTVISSSYKRPEGLGNEVRESQCKANVKLNWIELSSAVNAFSHWD